MIGMLRNWDTQLRFFHRIRFLYETKINTPFSQVHCRYSFADCIDKNDSVSAQ